MIMLPRGKKKNAHALERGGENLHIRFYSEAFKIKVHMFEFRFCLEYFSYATVILKLNMFHFF